MMMRVTGAIVTLWFFFVLFTLFVALVLSPMGWRLLLPAVHPVTWIYPALLIIPPVVLVSRRYLGDRVRQTLLWSVCVALTASLLILISVVGQFFFL